MKVTISHNVKQQILSLSLKQLFALLCPCIILADVMGL